jgi:predicted DCC family thiol-disulfide oxidoreductase YuxK
LKTARQVLVTQSVGLTPAEVSAAVWWVADGERLPGHRAVTRVLRELGGSWGIVGRVIAVPPLSWLGGPVYRWVATNRARF